MKIRLITTVMLALFLGGMLIASVPAASACRWLPLKPIICKGNLHVDWGDKETPPHWDGYVCGGIKGTVTFWENYPQENYVEGNIEYFFEKFLITTITGTIEGYDKGVYNLETFEFCAYGRVTAATGKCGYLEGWRFYEWGKTTPFIPIPGTEITGEATMIIMH